ncbi:hypothetical protein ACFE04_017926 [Oxalis oulophora]
MVGGGVLVWGNGDYGRLGLDSGSVYATGLNDYGQLGISTTLQQQHYTLDPLHVSGFNNQVRYISAGYSHSCAITVDGELYVWGNNANGQLGLGIKSPKLVSLPTQVQCLKGISIQMAALASDHSIAVTDGGETLSWGGGGGGGASGKLGHGHHSGFLGLLRTTSEHTPRLIKQLDGVKLFVRNVVGSGSGRMVGGGVLVWGNGDYGRLGLDSGSVYATGLNDYGQLGISTTLQQQHYTLDPLHVSGFNNQVRYISAGYSHSCAITVDGELYVWGNNANGQLGLGIKSPKLVSLPTQVQCLKGISIQMAALASDHSIAVTDGGETLSWGGGGGGGASGKLGHGHHSGFLGLLRTTSEHTPRLIKQLDGVKVKNVAAGLLHSACVDDNGSVFVFGERAAGKVGFREVKGATTPGRVSEVPYCKEVACGGYHTCVVTNGGELYSWGSNENGCLGVGSTEVYHLPERVQGPFLESSVSQVSCGWKHSAAISEGNVFTWGWGGSYGSFSEDGHSSGGQLGHGSDVDHYKPEKVELGENVKAVQVSCGFNHTAMYSSNLKGFILAIVSSAFIGSSFIIKKKGLRRASINGLSAGSGGYAYLKEPLWWLVIVGELSNFAAYIFAPAVLVTPLGALSIIVSAALAHFMLDEKLTKMGVLGCLICIVGSTVIVLHAPEEKLIDSVIEIWEFAVQPAFLLYMAAAIAVTLVLIFFCVPRYGQTNILVYLGICSIIGSLTVMSIKAIGIAIKLTIQGTDQAIYFQTWIFAMVAITYLYTPLSPKVSWYIQGNGEAWKQKDEENSPPSFVSVVRQDYFN